MHKSCIFNLNRALTAEQHLRNIPHSHFLKQWGEQIISASMTFVMSL